MVHWFELDEKERISEFYSKYAINDFWNWWSKGEDIFMEVRIKDFNLIREVATTLSLPYNQSGIYVNNGVMLKNVIAKVRDRATVWFGINPRKKNWNKHGKKWFGGSDNFVDCISFMFIDIDRIFKVGMATNEELKYCDILANLVLDKLNANEMANDYIKIVSGNGVQLLIRLDIPIKMPDSDFDNNIKQYIENKEFEIMRQLQKQGIGEQIIRFTKRYKDELRCEVDKSSFLLNKVAALPCTKNFKHGGFRWRGIVEIKSGVNTGLSDYILSKEDDIKTFKEHNIFAIRKLSRDYIIRPGKLAENELVKFMLENELPAGIRNNTVWMSLKILLRDSHFDLRSDEFKKIHKLLEVKQRSSLTLNLPDKKYSFNESIVNNFCIQYMIPPLYKLWPNKTKKLNMKLEHLKWENKDLVDNKIELDKETSIFDDLKKCKLLLSEGNINNPNIVGQFLKGLINKYGEKTAKYYFDYLIPRYLQYE